MSNEATVKWDIAVKGFGFLFAATKTRTPVCNLALFKHLEVDECRDHRPSMI